MKSFKVSNDILKKLSKMISNKLSITTEINTQDLTEPKKWA